jgi:hypothetical protein
MNQTNSKPKRSPADIMRAVNAMGRARIADGWATKSLIEALAKKRKAEETLVGFGLTPETPLAELLVEK